MNTSSQLIPILLNLVAAVLSALGQYCYKLGSMKLGQIPIYKNYFIFIGIFFFTIIMFLFLASFKLGGRLSTTYPVYMTTLAWGVLIGVIIDKEPLNLWQAVGISTVLVGIFIVAFSTSN